MVTNQATSDATIQDYVEQMNDQQNAPQKQVSCNHILL